MPGPGDKDGNGGDNTNNNQATLEALGRIYASLAPQGNTNAIATANMSGASGNSGLPFGLDVSSLLGASPAAAVAMLAAAAAKQYAPSQHQLQQPNAATPAAMNNNNNTNNNSNPIAAVLASLSNNKASANAGGLTPQQISALSAALGHQNATAPTAPAVSGSSSLFSTSAASHQTSSSNAGSHHMNVQALLKSVAAGQPINTSALPQQPTPNAAASSYKPQHQFQAQPQQHAVFPKAFNMHNCSKEQLESQVKLLRQMGQPVPQSMSLLLADFQKKEMKKAAKRQANRKSASSSRARKKALVEEMSRANQRLRRQALILSLLPDLILTIQEDGSITFASAQVERQLQHKVDDLLGASINDILIPESRKVLHKLVDILVNPAKTKDKQVVGDQPTDAACVGNKAEANGESAVPMEVVKLNAMEQDNDDSDTSGGKGAGINSSLTNSTPRSPSASLANNSGSDPEDGTKAVKESAKGKQRLSSSDDSSSGSTEYQKANAKLASNVRCKLKSMSTSAKSKVGHKDDVLGEPVTSNNALARLSSLQHHPEEQRVKYSLKKRKASSEYGNSSSERSSPDNDLLAGVEEKKKEGNNESASDDSGYREDFPEDSPSNDSSSESSTRGRNKPLAPNCNVCLIRGDLTSLWCEVTSSIRTRNVEDDIPEENTSTFSAKVSPNKGRKGFESKSTVSFDDVSEEIKTHEVKEILLCLRPIRDGDQVDPKLRFKAGEAGVPAEEHINGRPVVSSDSPLEGLAVAAIAGGLVSESSNGEHNSSSEPNSSSAGLVDMVTESSYSSKKAAGLPKKRPPSGPKKEKGPSKKRQRVADSRQKPTASASDGNANDAEKSVVESLMLMSNNKSS